MKIANCKLVKRAGSPYEVYVTYGIPLGTLANMRWKKVGPKFYRQGRRIVYFFDDVEAWLKENPVLTIDSLPAREG